MNYPHYTEYELLYKRFFTRPVSELIDLAGIKDGDKVLDLCCGGGRLSFAAKQAAQNVSVVAVDAEADMIPKAEFKTQGIKWLVKKVDDLLFGCYIDDEYQGHFNVVFCQQAINYWFNDCRDNMKTLRDLMAPGGRFVFNTFANKPDTSPQVKHYELDGHKYVEISRLRDNNIVHHIQVCDDRMHETEFDWISPEEFYSVLSPFFDVKVYHDGKTDIYVCTAPGK